MEELRLVSAAWASEMLRRTRMMPFVPELTASRSPHHASLHQLRLQPPSLSTVPLRASPVVPAFDPVLPPVEPSVAPEPAEMLGRFGLAAPVSKPLTGPEYVAELPYDPVELDEEGRGAPAKLVDEEMEMGRM